MPRLISVKVVVADASEDKAKVTVQAKEFFCVAVRYAWQGTLVSKRAKGAQ